LGAGFKELLGSVYLYISWRNPGQPVKYTSPSGQPRKVLISLEVDANFPTIQAASILNTSKL
jgi:hypothetical protein